MLEALLTCEMEFDAQERLLASVGSKVHIFEWRTGEDTQRELVMTCTYHGLIMALYVSARGDFIIVGMHCDPLRPIE